MCLLLIKTIITIIVKNYSCSNSIAMETLTFKGHMLI